MNSTGGQIGTQGEHSNMVRALRKPGTLLIEQLTPAKADLQHMAIGVAGEAGELLDAVKKHTVYNKDLDLLNVIEELGDMEFYLEGVRQNTGITREECLVANISKLAKRYEQFKYTDQAAHARADKQ